MHPNILCFLDLLMTIWQSKASLFHLNVHFLVVVELESGTAARNRLNRETFEALQIVEHGYHTGIISASQQAKLSSEEFWDDEWVQAVLSE